ncbi:hypothetical protein J5N97_029483 [Dioscorea zingiberensis]|uniref:USP domain-containing protein n=1 Tax=Dioscorea zingiberensis TaxID=325984 RepID=A0A9D5C0V9_9LILI|nr:hypothetical protein J5N97_029483 [Dioscorea zingiberensis]
MLDLSLEINDADEIMGSLMSFTRVEKLDDPENRFNCNGCKGKVAVEKQLTIDRAPEVLIIQLKRFNYNGHVIEKNFKNVSYPWYLDLYPFVNGATEKDDLLYRLYAIIVHHGSTSSGHYISYIHSTQMIWYQMNDDAVIQTSFTEAMAQKAYILFYVKDESCLPVHSFINNLVMKREIPPPSAPPSPSPSSDEASSCLQFDVENVDEHTSKKSQTDTVNEDVCPKNENRVDIQSLIGVTCYMNSILQSLAHTVPLIKSVLTSPHYRECPYKESNDNDKNEEKKQICLLCALRNHIIITIQLQDYLCYIPRIFIDSLTDVSSNFVENEQQDAHEYLLCLLTKLHECCQRSPATNTQASTSAAQTSIEAESPISQIFGGKLRSQIRCCACGHRSQIYEPVFDLSLEIGEADDLVSALESFTRVEKIDDPENLFTCDGCKAKVVVEKQLTVEKAPEVLIIQLKRFSCDGNSIQKEFKYVEYPSILDLTPFSSESAREENLTYRLYAVVVHFGSPLDGHYVSFVHSHELNWYLKDDSKEKLISADEAMGQRGYILFYLKGRFSTSYHTFIEFLTSKRQPSDADKGSSSSSPGEFDGGSRCDESDVNKDTNL